MESLFHWLRWGRQEQRHQPLNLRFAVAPGSAQPAPAPAPAPAAAEPPLELLPWTIARLQTIGREVLERPSQASLLAARSARDCLCRFWLAAPVDAMEQMFAGPIGEAYRQLLAGALPALPLDAAEAARRQQLADYLQQGFERNGSINVLLALLPYLDREAMQVHEPLLHLPDWLLPLYAERCEPGLGVSAPGARPQPPTLPAARSSLPELAPITGAASMALIGDADFLGRINGLLHLYGLEPGDPEICRDLSLGRRQLAQVWLDVESEQLESLYQTPFGELTDQLIRSRFAQEPLSQDELALRQQLVELAADLSHPHALNALMAALLYYPIEQVTLPLDPALIPAWLAESLRRHGAQPAPSR